MAFDFIRFPIRRVLGVGAEQGSERTNAQRERGGGGVSTPHTAAFHSYNIIKR